MRARRRTTRWNYAQPTCCTCCARTTSRAALGHAPRATSSTNWAGIRFNSAAVLCLVPEMWIASRTSARPSAITRRPRRYSPRFHSSDSSRQMTMVRIACLVKLVLILPTAEAIPTYYFGLSARLFGTGGFAAAGGFGDQKAGSPAANSLETWDVSGLTA